MVETHANLAHSLPRAKAAFPGEMRVRTPLPKTPSILVHLRGVQRSISPSLLPDSHPANGVRVRLKCLAPKSALK